MNNINSLTTNNLYNSRVKKEGKGFTLAIILTLFANLARFFKRNTALPTAYLKNENSKLYAERRLYAENRRKAVEGAFEALRFIA